MPVLLDSGETEATKSRICGLLATQIGFFPNHNTKPKKAEPNQVAKQTNKQKKASLRVANWRCDAVYYKVTQSHLPCDPASLGILFSIY